MKRTLCAIGLASLCLTWAAPGLGAILCIKKSGVVVVRGACKQNETRLDLAQFGAVGPRGDKGDPGPKGIWVPQGRRATPGRRGHQERTSCPAPRRWGPRYSSRAVTSTSAAAVEARTAPSTASGTLSSATTRTRVLTTGADHTTWSSGTNTPKIGRASCRK